MNLDNVFKGLSVSASGLMAERVRMGLIATNIAHSHDTNIGDGSAYKRKIPVFETILEGEMAGGVSVKEIVHDHETAHVEKHMPGHPDANAQGMVTLPNVNPTFEMVDLMTSSRAYEANLQAMNKAVQMAEQALELGTLSVSTPIDMNALRIAESLGNLAGDQAQDAKVEGKQFGDVLKDIVTETDRLQDEAGTKVEDFSKGKTDDVHDVMMAMSKADVSFRMMLEVRNKLVEAYQEVMRIQV